MARRRVGSRRRLWNPVSSRDLYRDRRRFSCAGIPTHAQRHPRLAILQYPETGMGDPAARGNIDKLWEALTGETWAD